MHVRQVGGFWNSGCLLLALALFPAEHALACSTGAWSGVVGAPLTGGAAEGVVVYSGSCALQPRPSAVGYVVESEQHQSEGVDTPYRARFHIYTGAHAGRPLVFRALDAVGGSVLVEVEYDPAAQNFRFAAGGSALSTSADSAPRDQWIQVEIAYQSGQVLQASTWHMGVAETLPATLKAGPGAINAIQWGWVAGASGGGSLSFDAFESYKSIAPSEGSKQTQSIHFGSAPVVRVGVSKKLSASGGASGHPVLFASTTPDVCVTSGSHGETVSGLAVGTCIVEAAQAGNDQFTAAPAVSLSFAVGDALLAQVIDFSELPDRTFGDQPFALVAGGGDSGNPVTFASQSLSVCTTSGINGSTLSLVAAGTCVVRASQAGNEDYEAATDVDRSFGVGKAPQAIQFSTIPELRAGSSVPLSASGGASGSAVVFSSLTPDVCTVSGMNGATLSGVVAGECSVAADQAGSDNYHSAPRVTRGVEVMAALIAQHIEFTAPGDRTFGDAAFTVTAAGGSSGNPVKFDSRSPDVCATSGMHGEVVSIVGAGSCTLRASQEGSDTYAPAADVDRSFLVSKAVQSIVFEAPESALAGESVALSAVGGGSGQSVRFRSLTGAVCSVTGTQLSALALGDCEVSANQDGNANYLPAPEERRVVQIRSGAGAPAARNDYYSVDAHGTTYIAAAIGVLANDARDSGMPVDARLVLDEVPLHGSLDLDSEGALTYTPVVGYEGSDQFSYLACSGDACSKARVILGVVAELDTADQYLWQVPTAANAQQQGFIRVTNRGNSSGMLTVWGIDGSGRRSSGTVTLTLGPQQSTHFNSSDLEHGNPDKGLGGALGEGEGDWLLVVRSEMELDALAYIRTPDGFVTSMHDRVEGDGTDWVVPLFNPASNSNQVSRLRIVNTSLKAVDVQIVGIDDAGHPGLSSVITALPPLSSRIYDAVDLEGGNSAKGLVGQLGDGEGKWRLTVSATDRVTVQSLLADPEGYLTNLSTFSTSRLGDDHVLWMVTPADQTQQQGFLRLTNLSDRAGTLTLWGVDDRGQRSPGMATLALGAHETRHLNSQDLENGNTSKGLAGSLGNGEGNWRIYLSTDLDLLPMGLIRTPNGFVTTMHDLVARQGAGWRVPMFNPGSNPNQVSVLRVVNPGSSAVNVSIAGVDDAGQAGPGGAASFTLAANAAVEFTAQELEQGSAARGLVGNLGDGNGKWWLQVSANAEIKVISMLRDPNGYLTNLSNETRSGAASLDP